MDANLQQSKRRAAAEVAYLVSKGVAAERLESEGFGDTRPIAVNVTNSGREKNRRVEFVIVPPTPSTGAPP
jgi:outer membrane protein OmpA-like peptidoglycan-associated protein